MKVNDGYKYLFHNRRNTFHNGDALIAEKKMVYESSDKKGNKNLYLSGIHVIETEELCRKYLRRFKRQDNKTIIVCVAYNFVKKPKGNKGVLLADKIIVLREVQYKNKGV